MLNLECILRDDRLLRAMIGLNRKAFENLLPSFSEAYQQSRSNPEVERKRAPGGGQKATLRTTCDKLFYILLYCKCYPTFDLMSVLFGFDRSCAWDWVHGLLPVLEETLGHKQVLPERKVRNMEEFLDRFPEVKEVIFDGTDRPVQRPTDPDNQKEYYSGKKKRHTRKHIIGSMRKKRVILLTKARGGKIHDKRQLADDVFVGDILDKEQWYLLTV